MIDSCIRYDIQHTKILFSLDDNKLLLPHESWNNFPVVDGFTAQVVHDPRLLPQVLLLAQILFDDFQKGFNHRLRLQDGGGDSGSGVWPNKGQVFIDSVNFISHC